MKAVVVTIEAQQPVLVTSFQGDPNSDVSYSFIPGSAIRGALIGRYLKRNGLGSSDIVIDPAIRSLFFEGTTRYLNAYLYNAHERRRTLPTPSSWYRDKYASLSIDSRETMQIYDLSQTFELSNELSLRSVEEPFCAVSGNSVRLHRDNRRINVHNQRNRRKGRSTEGGGEIFRYDALDAGQTFQFVVLCDSSIDTTTITDLLKPTDIWLGGSQTAGYGHCEITNIDTVDDWNEVGQPIQGRIDSQRFQITLLSPLIIRDDNGQYVTTPPTDLLTKKLGISLKLHMSFASREYVGGFNRKWGLPLPQVPAIAAGSVFVYTTSDNTGSKGSMLATLEAQGIGERRIDGFGRIVFNWLREENIFTASKPPKRSSAPVSLTSESQSIAEAMAIRLLRKRLDGYLVREVGRYDVTLAPTNSQLSRLILTARKALLEIQQDKPSESEDKRLNTNRQIIDVFFKKLPSKAARQFEQAKISNKPFEQQITDWLDNPDESWLTHPPSVTIADVTKTPTNLLKREYALHLIMAVAKKAVKEKNDD